MTTPLGVSLSASLASVDPEATIETQLVFKSATGDFFPDEETEGLRGDLCLQCGKGLVPDRN